MSVSPEQIKQAQDILAAYGQELEPEFDGCRWYWHAWHAAYKCYYQTWEERVGRIITIGAVKPYNKRAQRFALYRPVAGALPQNLADASCALDDAYRARADASRAWDDAYRARADASRAWDDAYRAWADAYRANSTEIDSVWCVECPDAVAIWSEDKNELVFGGAK